jgi:hypothetical protein
MRVRLRCISVVHGTTDVKGKPGLTEKTSETATFGDEAVPLGVLTDRKCCLHLHSTDTSTLDQFEVGHVYTFVVCKELP